jgi:hypothetical protein
MTTNPATLDPARNRPSPDPSPAPSPDAGPDAGPGHRPVGSVRHAGTAAGAGLLLMAVLAVIGNFLAVQGLVAEGDPARTATAIDASGGLFRLGIASLVLVVALDVVVAWGLYLVFRPVDAGLSMLAAAFRLVYAAVFLVAIGSLVGAADLLDPGERLPGLRTEQVQALALRDIGSFQDAWSIGLGLFGLHLLLLGFLAYRSGFAPRVIGLLLVLAGAGYLFDSFAAILVGDGAPTVSMFTFLGEVLLAVWLLVRGRRLPTAGPISSRTRGAE